MVFSCSKDADTIKVKLAISSPPDMNDFYYWTANTYKDLAESYTDGAVDIKIYDSMKLGSEQQTVQDVIKGNLEMTLVAVNNVTPFAPSIGFYDLPYIFKSREDFYKVSEEIMPSLNEQLKVEAGIKVVLIFDQGFRVLTNSSKPVYSLDDLNGLKIRTPKNFLQKRTFENWGAKVETIPWRSTTDALLKKQVDGQENPYLLLKSMKFYLIQKYITDIHYKLWIGPIITNHDWYNSLEPDVREKLNQAAIDTMKKQRRLIIQRENEALQYLIKKEMVVCGTPKDEDLWEKKALSLWPEFYKLIGGRKFADKAVSIIKNN